MECIRQIIETIPQGAFFDSHFVIDRMIKDCSDDYLNFCGQFKGSNITLTAHQQIGHQIAKFEGQLVRRQQSQSWSTNIHGNGSPCALWTRI